MMYRLTPRMVQTFRQHLTEYHKLFSAGRCVGWELEELPFRAIQSDNNAQHHAFWRESGHDSEADITVRIKDHYHYLQIKFGKIQNDCLVISGYRHGKFEGDLARITHYLNSKKAEIVSVSYRRLDNNLGRTHIYKFNYVAIDYLRGLDPNGWSQHNKNYTQQNEHGVEFSLHPSMSWQVWWRIPIELLPQESELVIGPAFG